MSKILVGIKRADEAAPHFAWISNTLENLQRTVGGYIEVFPIGGHDVIICDEEGKLKGKPLNVIIRGEMIVGDIIITAYNAEGDFVSIYPEDVRRDHPELWNGVMRR